MDIPGEDRNYKMIDMIINNIYFFKNFLVSALPVQVIFPCIFRENKFYPTLFFSPLCQ